MCKALCMMQKKKKSLVKPTDSTLCFHGPYNVIMEIENISKNK